MAILNYINWNVSPEIFEIGSLQIRYYGVLFALGFYLSYIIVQRFYKKEGLNPEQVDKLTLYVLLGAVIGARLGHIFFYEPAYYLAHPVEILKVWHGGLASHGGTIGILLALVLYVRKYEEKYLWILDRIAIPTALTAALIRLGNLMNSEIYGGPTELPWGFVFMQDGQTTPHHPTQIYEMLSYLVTFGLLWFIYKKTGKSTPNGLIVGIFLMMVFGMRFLIEFIKNDQVAFEANMALNMGQWLSIPFVLVGAFLTFKALKNK